MTPPTSGLVKADRDLLIRLDEHSRQMTLAIEEMRGDLEAMQGNFITRAEFTPVRALVFGAVAVILLAVLGAMVALTLNGGSP